MRAIDKGLRGCLGQNQSCHVTLLQPDHAHSPVCWLLSSCSHPTRQLPLKRHASIPEPLRGSWALSADACKNEDKSALVLSAKAFTGSEGSCSVLWVSETASVRGPTYSARLRCTNQRSQKRSESNVIIRPDDGTNQISMGADFSSLETYQRCSPSEPATRR